MNHVHDVHYVDPAPGETRVRADMLAYGLSIAHGNMVRSQPRRMITGIAISSALKNSKGTAFRASGMKWLGEVPLVWGHGPYDAIGVVRRASARDDNVLFTAELMNGPDVIRNSPGAEDLWTQMKRGAGASVSVGTNILRVAADDPHVATLWAIVEITLTHAAADKGARVTSVYEHPHAIFNDGRPWRTVFWDEGVAV